MDPGGSLVKTTWPPLPIVATAMTTLSSNVSLIPSKKLPLYFRTTRRAWLVFCCWDKHLPHFSSGCFSNDLSGIIIASDHPLDFLGAVGSGKWCPPLFSYRVIPHKAITAVVCVIGDDFLTNKFITCSVFPHSRHTHFVVHVTHTDFGSCFFFGRFLQPGNCFSTPFLRSGIISRHS